MIRLRAFGPPAVLDGDRVLSGAAAQPRRLALLALLAEAGDRGLSRDKLLLYLWPDATEERARKSLTQAVYALRRDLGRDDALLGARDLQLNPAVITSDLADFRRAMAEGRHADAVALYLGPFLDGFHLSQLPEFEEWAEAERRVLARQYADAVDRVAEAAHEQGDPAEAVRWRRTRVALDPHHAPAVMALMQALADAGDRGGALEAARSYQRAMKADLGVAPDPSVEALAERLRREWHAGGRSVAPPARAELEVKGPRPTGPAPVKRARRPLVPLLAAVLVASAWLLWLRRGRDQDLLPVMAVGRIEDYTGADSAGTGRVLADLLATNLARNPTLRVVSTARLYELQHQLGGNMAAPDPGLVMTAARRAGATRLLDGAIHRLAPGRFRLDLRQLDVDDGSVTRAFTVEGPDLFALADSGTRVVLGALGLASPSGSVADVTARSVAAVRLYEEGLRAWVQGNRRPAEQLFLSALAEDSAFAMAAFHAALSSSASAAETIERWRRALALAERASDRERLLIRARAFTTPPAVARAAADSFAARFPDDPEARMLAAVARYQDGDPVGAAGHLRRVIAMDSLGLAGDRGPCRACDAYALLVEVWWSADSLNQALAAAREWRARRPAARDAAYRLMLVLAALGDLDGVRREGSNAVAIVTTSDVQPYLVRGQIGAGQVEEAERVSREWMALGQLSGPLYLAMALRYQGRYAEALDAARRHRAMLAGTLPPERNTARLSLAEAAIRMDLGDFRGAAILYDSMASQPRRNEPVELYRRQRAWYLMHLADAVAALGDTVRLKRLVDTLAADSAFTLGRERYHWHARGLLAAARGRDPEAVDAFRRAIVSPTLGHIRSNASLARALLRLGRPAEAVPVLQAALRGDVDQAVTRTELRALLAEAWRAAGRPDSAAVHQAWVDRVRRR